MLLTISAELRPASDLGYLLYKHPDKVQKFSLNFGKAHVFYPEVDDEQATVALLVDVDPIKLTRRAKGDNFALQPYVNDRPYAASSFFSVALLNVFRTAMKGESVERPVLAQTALPLTATLSVVPARGGEGLIRRLFEPLGYAISAENHPLDPTFPEWGSSRYFTLTLSNTIRLADLLNHLYVLIPVLDDDKHYWVGEDEVDKLLQKGGDWLAQHPAKEEIANRYLKRRRSLTRSALAQLSNGREPDDAAMDAEEGQAEERIGLHQQRLQAVSAELVQSNATRILDLGCGEGKLLRLLLRERQFEHILAMDVSVRSLERLAERIERMYEHERQRVEIVQGSLMYRDERLAGYDAAAVVEVIEHLDPPRLAAFERVLFEFAKPHTVVLTTPNREYNALWPSLPAGTFRHRDHRFEWTRAEFAAWCQTIADRFDYQFTIKPIGELHKTHGAPSQMAIFSSSTVQQMEDA